MGVDFSPSSTLTKMSKLLVVLAALLVVASAAPQSKLQCPMDAIFACVGEVSGAWDNCWNAGDIMSLSRASSGLETAGTVPVMSSHGSDSWTANHRISNSPICSIESKKYQILFKY